LYRDGSGFLEKKRSSEGILETGEGRKVSREGIFKEG
jgi:hypothetical protein